MYLFKKIDSGWLTKIRFRVGVDIFYERTEKNPKIYLKYVDS